MQMSVHVEHLPDRSRFQAVVDGHAAFAEYHESNGVIAITHTEVPKELEGRGIAGTLVRTLLEHARRQGLKVLSRCSYASAYLDRHPEYSSLLA